MKEFPLIFHRETFYVLNFLGAFGVSRYIKFFIRNVFVTCLSRYFSLSTSSLRYSVASSLIEEVRKGVRKLMPSWYVLKLLWLSSYIGRPAYLEKLSKTSSHGIFLKYMLKVILRIKELFKDWISNKEFKAGKITTKPIILVCQMGFLVHKHSLKRGLNFFTAFNK